MKLLVVEDSKLLAERLCQALASITPLSIALIAGCAKAVANTFFDKAPDVEALAATVRNLVEAVA